MRNFLRDALVGALLIVAIVIGCECVLLIREARHAMQETSQSIAEMPDMLERQLQATRTDMNLQLVSIADEMALQVSGARQDIAAPVQQVATAVDRLGNMTAVQMQTLVGETAHALEGRSDDLAQVLQHLNKVALRLDETSDILLICEDQYSDCLPNQIQGTLSSAELAAQASARMATDISDAIPKVITNVQRTTEASVGASQATEGMMKNLEKQSKPMPMIVRFTPQAVQAILLAIGILK